MAPRNAARMQQTGGVPLPPELVRQTNILRTEHVEVVREHREMKEKLEAVLRENEQLKKDKKGIKSAAGKGDDGVQQSDGKWQQERQKLVAEREKLKVDLKRVKKRLDTEQGWNKQLTVRNSQLEVNLQATREKHHTLVRQIQLRENRQKAEIQDLNSKLRKMAEAQRDVYQNRSLQAKKSRWEVKSGARMETDTESERKASPSQDQPKQSASYADSEYPENQKPTAGYEPRKVDRIFWSTEDEYSGAEVVAQVEKLNSEMLQVAANIADELDLEHQVRGRQEPEGSDNITVTEAIKRTTNIIGPQLTSMLATSDGQYVGIITQTALQTALLMHTQRIISSWLLWDRNENRTLWTIHKKLQESEPQSVSGRWRQLTKTCLRSNNFKGYEDGDLLLLLTDSLVNIVIATGYNLDQAAVKEIFRRFSSQLEEIIELSLQVNTMIGEGITSCDFEITYVPPDSSYNPEYMETVYGGNSPIHGKEWVICTVDLGLMKVVRVSKPPEVSHTRELVLLKPKVLLPPVFDVVQNQCE